MIGEVVLEVDGLRGFIGGVAFDLYSKEKTMMSQT